ncbi:hypothetical protein SpCBS45565_g05706 [Spizellomyces sp. 'palustris']|nr:hypothetical protein SpCBS45565_g05706 [Spizellomyces sp. 'palustris']
MATPGDKKPLPPPMPYESLPDYHNATSSSAHFPYDRAPQEGDALIGSDGHSEKFNRSPKYKDVWATALFGVHLVVLVLLAVAGFRVDLPPSYASAADPSVPIGDNLPLSALYGLIAVMIFGGLGLTVAYFMALERYARHMIQASFFLNTAISAVIGLFYLASGAVIPAAFALVYAGVHIFMYFAYRSRMEFARVILENVTTVTKMYPGTVVAGILGVVGQTVWSIGWIIAAIGCARVIQTADSDGVKYAVAIYLSFSLYWTSQIIKNVVHVTVSGVFATFYFTGISTADGAVVVPVRNPTLKSAKRALTTSFGPIAFGSLIIALIQTLRGVLQTIRRNAQEENNNIMVLAATCAECILSLIEGLVAFINVYAYTQVAIYGKSYLEAARDTWSLLRARGIDLIINDDLTSGVLTMGALLIGLANAFVAYVFLYLSSTPKTKELEVITAIIAFVVAFAQFWVLAETIRSGVATTFVCLAEDPIALARTKPDLYEKIRAAYPRSAFASDV